MGAAEIRLEHEMDKKRLGDSTVTFDRTLNDLRGAVDHHAQGQNKKHGDHNESIQSLKEELEQETKARTKDRNTFMTALNNLTAKVESDGSDRQATQNEMSERFTRQLTEALSSESQERMAALQQERSARDQSLVTLRQNVENCKMGLTMEKDERAAEFTIFAKKAATTESQLLQQIDEIKLGLEGETNLRVAGDDRIERRLGELRGNFDAHTTSSASLMHEIDHRMRALSQALDTEVRSRSDEGSRNLATTNQLKELLSSSDSNHAKNCDAINEKIKVMGGSLLDHERGRVSAGEELMKKVKDVAAMIEVERHERDQGDANTKAHVEGLKQALASEKEERINELSAFRRNMHVEDGKVKQALEDLKHSVDLEAGKRSAADERIERRTSEYKASIDEITGRCTEMTEDLDKVAKAFRQGLDQEARLRSDDTMKIQTAMNRVQDLLDGEVGDRQQACADLMERIRVLSDNLNQEAKDRASGDDESARLVITVRQSLEKEVKERKMGESEADQRMHDLGAAVDHERIDREREDTVLRTQVAGLRQEIVGEKDERVADMAANKRQLSSLEGQLTQQMRDLRHNLDTEQSDRFAMCERIEKSCSDIRMSVDSNRAAEDAVIKELEKTIRSTRQAVEAETKDRINMFEEYNRSLAEMRTTWSAFRSELASEKDERIEEISALRVVIQNFDQKVNVQFKDYKIGLENEMAERMSNNERLEKRLAELRGAVLVAVRGPAAAR